jgi:hypothetical protein
MRKLRILGKEIPVILVVSVLLIGVGSATLLTYYGVITANITVKQSILLDSNPCTNATGLGCTSGDTVNAVGSETRYGSLHTLSSNTVNNLSVKFANIAGCEDTIITNLVKLSVDGFTSGDGFAPENYKGTYYEATPLVKLTDLNTMTYAFTITDNTMGSSNLAPYVVLIGSGFEGGVAVQMIPDGGTYATGTDYVKIINDTTTFHVPGGSCTQISPCTLTQLKAGYPSATISSVKLALGAWPGSGTVKAYMGLSTINGQQAIHKSLVVYGLSSIPMQNKYDFAKNIMAGTCTITTNIIPL